MIANITPQEIAVAKEIAEHDPYNVDRPWEHLSAVEHHGYLQTARAAIKAALDDDAASTIRALVAEIERLRDKRDEMSVEAARLFELHRQAEAKLREAVEVITSAPVRPDCDWKCKECNCGVRAWDDRRDAFLATMEKQ